MDTAGVVQAYGEAWNETDEDSRRRLLESAWADDGSYCDPMATANGREALVAHIGGFQATMPGHRIDVTTGVDEHDRCLRFGWAMSGPDGAVLMEGTDFGTLAADGRLQRIVGFFGGLVPVAAVQ